MTTTTLDTKVQDFLAQKRLAVAGVSRDRSHHPVGNLIYQRLKTTGHEVFAVNPHMQTFEGDRCYPDLQSIPGGVDGVVIITRPATTQRIVRDCNEAGVRRVWMHQSLGKGSTSVSPEAVEYCRQHDISVIAGACPMMYGDGADFGHTCMKWILKLTGGLPSS
jgi:predicted CoA-binding protein